MAEKTRYSDEELAEFKQIILEKLDQAKKLGVTILPESRWWKLIGGPN